VRISRDQPPLLTMACSVNHHTITTYEFPPSNYSLDRSNQLFSLWKQRANCCCFVHAITLFLGVINHVNSHHGGRVHATVAATSTDRGVAKATLN
jgi:hypothetical protein